MFATLVLTLLLASTGSCANTSQSSTSSSSCNGTKIVNPILCTPVSTTDEESLIRQINLYFFYGSTVEEHVVVPLSNATTLLDDPNWVAGNPMVLFVPGWKQSPTGVTSAEPMVKAYGQNKQFNFIILDWYAISNKYYGIAVTLVPRVGTEAALALQALLDRGEKLDSLVGHSLGAHISGYIGRNLLQRPRFIAALDAAGPGFSQSMIKCQDGICPHDGEYVMSVHTDWNGMGINEYLGPVDFMPNGGHRLQPGCTVLDRDNVSIACSHLRAISLYAFAFVTPDLLIGRKCSSQLEFTSGACSNNPTLKFTDVASFSKHGVYRLTTLGTSPFGKGENGI